ncbi:putative DNA double-strand break repair Rad50 ATPase [bacterium HR16]|nr:putative DNA double-strand break repair Rad50 ATPase [bacterium HR16]
MKLHRLQLTNFRQYMDLDLTFGDGITAIIGANGSGKSTLLEAICWSLYGAEALRSKVEEVRPLFLSLLDSASQRGRGTTPKAVLTFSLGDAIYEIERTAQGARLYRLQSEREAVADGTTAVNNTVQRLLGGMTYRQFLTSFFAQQGELEFLHFDKARRREEVLRMLGLERVTRSVKWIDEELAKGRSELRGKQSLPLSPEEAKAQLERAKEELETARADLQKAGEMLKAAKADWEHWKPVAEQWNAKKMAHDSLQMQVQLLEQNILTREGELNRLRDELSEAQKARARLEELRPQGERFKQVREQLRQLDELQRYEQRRAELRVQMENLAVQIKERETQLAEAEAELSRLQRQKEELDVQEQRVQELNEKAKMAEELRKKLEQMDKQKMAVQKQLSALDAQIASLNEQTERLKQQIASAEGITADEQRIAGLVGEAEGRVRELEAELAKLERQRASAIASAETEAKSVRQQMQEIEKRRKNVESLGPDGECPVCTRRLGEEYASVVKHFDLELQEAERRLQAALSRKAEAERDTEAIEQCRANLQEARADLQRYHEQLARLQEQLRQRDSWLQEAQSLQRQIDGLTRQREQVAASYDAQEHERVRQQVEELQPVAQQAMAEKRVWEERYSQWQREMDRVNNELEQVRVAMEQLVNTRQTAEHELQQLPTGYDATLHDQLRRELADLQPVWEEAQRLHPVAQRLPGLQARSEEVQSALQAARHQLEQTHLKLQELSYNEAEYQQVMSRFALCENALRDAETQVRVLQERVEQRAAQVAALEEQWQRLQEHLRELRELQHAVLRDETVRNWLRSFADLLNGEVVPELQERAGELLNLLTDGRYTQLQVSEEFEFTLVDEDRPKPIISGGEEDIVNLSLRLAMAEMICERSGQPLGLLVLDEVFGSLDADRRENTLQLLRRLRDRFDQIIIISHIEEIQAGADRCLQVDYSPSQHRSTVREVSLLATAEILGEEPLPETTASEPVSQGWGGLFDG